MATESNRRSQSGVASHNHRAWTSDDDKLLKVLWIEGWSASDIAPRFAVTRNAVIGRIHRIGLSGSDRLTVPSSRPKRKRKLKPEPVRLVRLPRPIVYAEPVKPVNGHDETCNGVGIDLLELTDTTCHWPLTDSPPHRFCGVQIDPGTKYCSHHRMRAGRVIEPRLYQRPRFNR